MNTSRMNGSNGGSAMMYILFWLLGIPLGVILILWLLGVGR